MWHLLFNRVFRHVGLQGRFNRKLQRSRMKIEGRARRGHVRHRLPPFLYSFWRFVQIKVLKESNLDSYLSHCSATFSATFSRHNVADVRRPLGPAETLAVTKVVASAAVFHPCSRQQRHYCRPPGGYKTASCFLGRWPVNFSKRLVG